MTLGEAGPRNLLLPRGISPSAMSAPEEIGMNRSHPSPKPDLTLLDLTGAVIEVSASDREVVATLAHLLRSGRVRFPRR